MSKAKKRSAAQRAADALRGRKPRAGAAGKGVTVLFSPDELATYRRAAESAEITLAAWIREACAEKLKRG